MSVSAPRPECTGRFTAFTCAFRDILPLSLAVLPWGVLCGTMAIKAGFSPLQAQFFSLLVFAGAAQLSASTMLAGGAGAVTVLGSTFAITSQHLLYSFTIQRHVIAMPLRWRAALAFLLTDELFAVTMRRAEAEGDFDAWHALLAGIIFYAFWNLATLFGILGGQYLAGLDHLGLDFAIVATFVAMTVPAIRDRSMLAAALCSAVVSVASQPWFPDLHVVIGALSGMVTGFALEQTRKAA